MGASKKGLVWGPRVFTTEHNSFWDTPGLALASSGREDRILPRKSFTNQNLLFCHSLSLTLWPRGLCSPGSSVHGISQARILERVIISFFNGSFLPRDWIHVSFIGRWILFHWATREAPTDHKSRHLIVRHKFLLWSYGMHPPGWDWQIKTLSASKVSAIYSQAVWQEGPYNHR